MQELLIIIAISFAAIGISHVASVALNGSPEFASTSEDGQIVWD